MLGVRKIPHTITFLEFESGNLVNQRLGEPNWVWHSLRCFLGR